MKQTSAVVNLGAFGVPMMADAFCLFACQLRLSFDMCMAWTGDVNRGEHGDSFGMGFKFPWQKK